jgi:hypothetical protein
LPTESTTEYMDLMSVGLIIQAAEIVMAWFIMSNVIFFTGSNKPSHSNSTCFNTRIQKNGLIQQFRDRAQITREESRHT